MGVCRTEWMKALGVFPEMAPVHNERDGSVSIIAAPIEGIAGGAYQTNRSVIYRVLVDVTHLRAQLPIVWVTSPSEAEIQHVNIFHPIQCSITHSPYPYLCWGNYGPQWATYPEANRTLLSFLQLIQQHLTHHNVKSVAR